MRGWGGVGEGGGGGWGVGGWVGGGVGGLVGGWSGVVMGEPGAVASVLCNPPALRFTRASDSCSRGDAVHYGIVWGRVDLHSFFSFLKVLMNPDSD